MPDDTGVNVSMAGYQTMTDFNAERNLFCEERIGRVGKTLTGAFAPGQKVGTTHMYVQEKLDGELGNFRL